ncbi:AMP-binding enzyme, partial [Aeromonas veronii]|uniref:AMP-binding enzyme n=1 Tax=Aeromonas veronii TaxID=654 RepID=UPI00406CDA26
RLKDNIDRGGEKFGTEDIEALINQHPAIADSKVVAMPDPQYGEKACAYLIAIPGAVLPNVKELGAFLGALGLANFKRPERIEAIDA